jgi:hypothetical protein
MADIPEIVETIQQVLKQFIELPDERSYDLLAVWITGTYCFESFDSYPYIAFQANKGCGKSKTLNLVEKLSSGGQLFVSPTVATVFRSVHALKPTLCFDELEFVGDEDSKELRQLLYSGYKRGATVPRSSKDAKPGEPPFLYNVYSPKCFASIKSLPDVMLDRCILIQLYRSINPAVANRNIPFENFLLNGQAFSWKGIHQAVKETVDRCKADIETSYRNCPQDKDIVGRAWELWQPLLAIGNLCGRYDSLRSYAFELLKLKAEEEELSLPAAVLNILNGMSLPEGKWVTNKEVLDQLNQVPEWYWVKSSYLGSVLKNMSFRGRHTRDGKAYYIKSSQVEQEAKRLGICLGDNRDVGDDRGKNVPANTGQQTLVVPSSEVERNQTTSQSSQSSQNIFIITGSKWSSADNEWIETCSGGKPSF